MNTVPRRRTLHVPVTIVMALLVLVPALVGFGMKFREFIALSGDDAGAFTVVPIINYLLATAGFFILLFWAILHGMFRNIEQPKHTMLEQEAELDEDERIRQLIGS
jgi:hypothetical protein